MARIIHIQRFDPNGEGFGGSHRVYQNYQDLVKSFSHDEIGVIPLSNSTKRIDRNRVSYYRRSISERIANIRQVIHYKSNRTILIQTLMDQSLEFKYPFGLACIDPYLQYLEKKGKPDVCIVDHPCYIDLACYNDKNDIATIYLPHNLEAFTRIVHEVDDSFMRIDCGLLWMAELQMLNLCKDRLMISLLETSLVRGLGLSVFYYPYLPVKDIRSRLLYLREQRLGGSIEKGLFLMVGSIFHRSTGEGFRWFLDNIKENGLPKGVHIVVGGGSGESLSSEYGALPRVEITGRIKQDELEELMKRACAVLIPQRSGFGALTRIPEMSCAGVPMIASEHSISAMHAPPGVRFVQDNWKDWISAMQDANDHPKTVSLTEYKDWEKSQSIPIKAVVQKYLKNH
jgi:glycosyltransferase involved in cell wall biosynthesis